MTYHHDPHPRLRLIAIGLPVLVAVVTILAYCGAMR